MTEGECKVDRVVRRYGMTPGDPAYDTIHRHLAAQWTGQDGRSAVGYRALTEWFNKRLLKQVYDKRGRETLGARLDNEYETLTGDDELLREELIDDLDADGIDGREITEDMVSWSTIRHHLKGCLGENKDTEPAATDWEYDSVRIASDQVSAKANEALRALASKGELPKADDAEVDVRVELSCPECPVRVPFEDAVSRGYICKDHLSLDESGRSTA